MEKSLAILTLSGTLLLAGCSANDSAANTSSQVDTPKDDEYTYKNGVANTKRMRVELTDHKVINPGEKGNEEGDMPVMAFWYTATNKSNEDIPLDLMWSLLFSGYQSGTEQLSGQGIEGISFASHTRNVKPGKTAKSAMGFKLTDKTTPLKLVVQDIFTNQKLGEQEFPVE
ncbi:DUF5067 domain-containing protein [Holzapfeliella sp. JNUCC 72]